MNERANDATEQVNERLHGVLRLDALVKGPPGPHTHTHKKKEEETNRKKEKSG